jgi:hypothetical protein
MELLRVLLQLLRVLLLELLVMVRLSNAATSFHRLLVLQLTLSVMSFVFAAALCTSADLPATALRPLVLQLALCVMGLALGGLPGVSSITRVACIARVACRVALESFAFMLAALTGRSTLIQRRRLPRRALGSL